LALGLRDIPFCEYQKFLVEGDVSVCGGEENAEKLYLEFCDITASVKSRSQMDIDNNILYYSLKISVVQTLIDSLYENYNEEIANILRNDLNFDYELSEYSYLADLKRIVTECTTFKVKLDEWMLEKERNMQKDGGSKPTYQYYADVTNSISQMIKSHIPDDINTLRWAGMYRDLITNLEKSKEDGARPN
jgi:hypothetical protein